MKIHNTMNFVAALLGSLAIVASYADAKPDKGNKGGKDKGAKHSQKEKGDNSGKKSDAPQFARFKDGERNEIVSYFSRFQDNGEGLLPGLAMNQRRGKPLPPGWQKKLTPGYRIDDNEWTSYAPVPSGWFPQLRMEPDTRLYHYGDRVVRVYEPRREVIDVIVLPGSR
jgi:hypothetical protein